MAEASSQLNPADSRTLLPFGPAVAGSIPTGMGSGGIPPRPRVPGIGRQSERLSPQFAALQQALAEEAATLTDATDASDPEHLVVFEIIGTVGELHRSVADSYNRPSWPIRRDHRWSSPAYICSPVDGL